MLELGVDYPRHLSEKIREEAAEEYLRHELKKIFPSIKDEEVRNLMNAKELCNPRDFWNGIHGVGMGFKLHIGFIYLITAENIVWTKETIRIGKLSFGVDREMIDKTPQVINKWDGDAIFVVEKDQGLAVYEGNNRLEKYISNGIERINAYVGRYTTKIKRPVNYWLPTSVLMDVLYYVYRAIDNKEEKMFESYINVLRDMLSFSESGKYEFLERALTSKTEYREKILEAMRSI
jgi:hypothetical protein